MPSYTPTFGTGDALCAQTLYYQKIFTDWLVANGQTGKGIITEMGIPGSSQPGTDPIAGSGTGATYDERWSNVVQQWFEAANRANLHVTAWNASEWAVDLRAYRTDDNNNGILNYRTTFSSVLENNLGNGTYMRGVNYAGGEFSDRGPGGSLDRSHLAQPNAGYYYPTPGSFPILNARGMILIRIPVRWERLQPTLKGALDNTEMTALAASINAAGAAGCKVLLDLHNYGRYDTTPTGLNTNGVYMLGQNAPSAVGGTMFDAFADFWSRIATYFNGNSAIWGYDICNEPHDLPAGRTDWQTASQRAVEAIRLVNQTVKIAVEGYSYATVPDWLNQNGASAWLTETIPAGQTGAGSARNTDPNILWNGHHYFDPRTGGFNGGYEDTYDNELAYAVSAGFGPYSTGGYVAPATNNTSQTALRTTFKTQFAATSDFGGTYDGIINNTNTVTLPYSLSGSPTSVMKVVCSTTSDEGGVRKSITAGNNARIFNFDYELDPIVAPSAAGDFCISHLWDNTFTNDLVEIRIIGNGTGYSMKMNTTGTGAVTASGTTILPIGSFNTMKLVVTDTNFQLFVNGAGTPEITLTASNTGKNIGGIAMGKFYGTQALTMYYRNVSAGVNATFMAPPNGGLIYTPTGGGGGGGSTPASGRLTTLFVG
jgi:hypothetical protein